MPEQIAQMLERLSGRPERFDELKLLLDDHDLRRQLLDFTDEVARGTSRHAAKEHEHARFYAELVQRECARMSGFDQLDAVAVVESATASINRALESAIRNRDVELLLAFSVHLTKFFKIVSKPHDALVFYRKLSSVTPLIDSTELLMHTRLNYGRSLLRLGEYAECEEEVTAARELGEQLGDEAVVADALTLLGRLATVHGSKENRRFFEEALARYREIGDQRGIAVSLMNLGTTDCAPDQQETYTREALEIFREIGNRYAESTCLHNLAALAAEQGRTDETRQLEEAGLTIKREIGDTLGIAQSLTCLGLAARAQSEFLEAERLTLQALELFREIGELQGQSAVLSNLGLIVGDLGRFEEGTRYFEECLMVVEQMGNPLLRADALSNLGEILLDQGKYQESEQSYFAAREICIREEYALGRADADLGLARIDQVAGNPESAKARLLEGLPVYREYCDTAHLACSTQELGVIDLQLGRFDSAHRLLDEARQLCAKSGSRDGVADALSYMALLAVKCSRYDNAAEYLHSAFSEISGVACPKSQILALTVSGLLLARQPQLQHAFVLLAGVRHYAAQFGLVPLPRLSQPAAQADIQLSEVLPAEERKQLTSRAEVMSLTQLCDYASSALAELKEDEDLRDGASSAT